MPRGEPIHTPLPHVADHVVEAVCVARVCGDWRGAHETVLRRVVGRELALPDVAAPFAIRRDLIAPRVATLVEAAARGVFPLGSRSESVAKRGEIVVHDPPEPPGPRWLRRRA